MCYVFLHYNQLPCSSERILACVELDTRILLFSLIAKATLPTASSPPTELECTCLSTNSGH